MQVLQACTDLLQDQDTQASLKKMFISNLCWKRWGGRGVGRHGSGTQMSPRAQGPPPPTSGQKEGCKTLSGSGCGDQQWSGNSKGAQQAGNEERPSEVENQEGDEAGQVLPEAETTRQHPTIVS